MAIARLILVTGKGGTGKSVVAAALALCLARRRPTLLVDLDQRMRAARMLGIESGNNPDNHRRDNSDDDGPRGHVAAATATRVVPSLAAAFEAVCDPRSLEGGSRP